MVPIHDTDLAEGRWTKAEWEHYELWEKIEQRFRRRKRLWILSAVAAYLMISAIPIARDRWPAWAALRASRELAQTISGLKRDSNLKHLAYRITFTQPESLEFVVEELKRCSDSSGATVVRTERLNSSSSGRLQLLRPEQGVELGVPGLVDRFCYDPLNGSELASNGKELNGFGLVPVNDLTDRRIDRLSILLLSGPNADASFD